MALKFLILAVLAIESVNAGVIKTRSSKTDFNDLITLLSEHVNRSSGYFYKVEEEYNNASVSTLDHALMAADAGISAFKQHEDYINSSRAAMCFKLVHREVSRMNEDLMTTTDRCLRDSWSAAKAFLDEANLYKETASALGIRLHALWTNCDHDAKCEKVVLENAERDVEVFSNGFNDFAGRIEAYLEKDFAKMQPCLIDYIDDVYFVDITKMFYRIEACIKENAPGM